MTFCFDNKLFQRGQTWQECLASWQTHRLTFLDKIANAPQLTKTSDQLAKLPPYTRFAVYYSNYKLDTWLSLPIIGGSLAAFDHLEVRFHCAEYFFPVMGRTLGRKTPLLMLLDQQGTIRDQWGPRPASVSKALEQMQNRAASDRDRWLVHLDPTRFAALLDEELNQFLENCLQNVDNSVS
ncbi:hypothetical protein [Acanthopleuribacter pedis]|uniref:Uncharacterized protein n=1 Tax=Acanthopleuribacter pedis TaxID=442870 RepID=A0A8J7QCG7_9BACT|nr:hypothetical protein [Acanthopleuribacter pedis]MBO1321579.1 hypothetical protein [Acanthopleuribacter pedis]